jgi:glucose-1-phosphate adenylyltransferase
LPKIIKEKIVYLYENKDPWFYIGNIKEYWETNMKMLNSFDVNPEQWGIRTNMDDRDRCYRKPAFFMKNSTVKNSIIGKGCEIDGEVISSILFPGVKVEKGAVIKDSIIMHDCHISKGCIIEKSVLDKDVLLNENIFIGMGENIPNEKHPENYNSGITIIGKNVKIPTDVTIGKNCLIYDNVHENNFLEKNIPSGSCVFKN